MQLLPDVHETQFPPPQTWLVPQEAPAALLPLSTQTETPVAHDVTPSLHGLVGWQAAPSTQTTHVPLLQTMPVAQAVPFGREVALSRQPMAGAQVVVPAWQGLLGAQLSPSVQPMQDPPLQILPVPHEDPLAALPDSIQVGAPVLHALIPVRHGLLATAQVEPAAQVTQVPVGPQTLSVPHAVPAATDVPLSTH